MVTRASDSTLPTQVPKSKKKKKKLFYKGGYNFCRLLVGALSCAGAFRLRDGRRPAGGTAQRHPPGAKKLPQVRQLPANDDECTLTS
jgi:hypothetical protein